MSQIIAEWYNALPDMPGHDGTKKLLRGKSEYGGNDVWVLVEQHPHENAYRLAYLDERISRGASAITKDAGPSTYFEVQERFGAVTLELLAQFVQSQKGWEYELEEFCYDVVRTFLNAKTIPDNDSWEAHVAAVYAALSEDMSYRLEDVPKPPDNLRGRVLVPLRGYMLHLLSLNDPRAWVAELEWVDGPEMGVSPDPHQAGLRRVQSHLLITGHAGVADTFLQRKLAAALPGVVVHDPENEEAEPPVLVMERGDFKLELWERLDKEVINGKLINLDNDPVTRVQRGDHAMQVLVALRHPVTQFDLDECKDLERVRHVAIAQPEWVYGGKVISLLVPDVDLEDESELESLEDNIRDYLRFYFY